MSFPSALTGTDADCASGCVCCRTTPSRVVEILFFSSAGGGAADQSDVQPVLRSIFRMSGVRLEVSMVSSRWGCSRRSTWTSVTRWSVVKPALKPSLILPYSPVPALRADSPAFSSARGPTGTAPGRRHRRR